MATTNTMTNAIQRAASKAPAARPGAPIAGASRNPSGVLSAMLDRDDIKARFDQILGKRAAQFSSSLISLTNASPELQKAAIEAPNTIIQAGLRAAILDLPIDNTLGYAYIIPFYNTVKREDGTTYKRHEAAFVLGYKGMLQLALRTGVYKTINVVDVRQGELKSYDRLTEEVDVNWIEDEDERDKLPVIGWLGYYKLINGSSKTIYMTKKQMENHEKKHRKGQYMGKMWREDFNAMAAKTMYRRLIGKHGIMSIEYQMQVDPATLAMAQDRMDGAPVYPAGSLDDEVLLDGEVVDAETGELIPAATEGQGA